VPQLRADIAPRSPNPGGAAAIDASGLATKLSPYAVLEEMADGFFALDDRDLILYVNAAAERMLGRERKGLVGRVLWDAFPDAPDAPFGAAVRRARTDGAVQAVSDRIPQTGGMGDYRIHPLPDGSVHVHVTDTSDQRLAGDRADQLAHLGAALSGAVTTQEVTAAILAAALPAFDAWIGVVARVSDDGRTLRVLDAVGFPEALPPAWQEFVIDDAPLAVAEAVRRLDVVVVPTPEHYVANYGHGGVLSPRSVVPGAAIAAPLLLAGRAVGSLGLICPAECVISNDARRFLLTVAGQCALAMERARLFDAECDARLRLERESRERASAEQALRGREEFLRRLIESSPDCIKTLNLDGRMLTMNEGGQRLFGVRDFSSIRGADYLTFWQDDRTKQAVRSAIGEARAGGVGHFEGACPTMDGAPKWWDVVIVPIAGSDVGDGDSGGVPERLLAVSRDITERHRTRERERFLSALSERTRALLDPDAVAQDTLSAVGEFLNAARCTFVEVDESAGTLTIRRDWTEPGMPSIVGTYSIAAFGNEVVGTLRSGRTLIVGDVSTDERLRPDSRDAFAAAGVRALVNVPIVKSGRWIGTFAVNDREPRAWTAEETELIEEVAARTWLAVENATLYRQAQQRAQRESLLSEASRLLNASLDYRQTLGAVARLVVPRFADWCAVDVVDTDGLLQRVVVEHIDPEKAAWGLELHRRYPTRLDAPRGIAAVLRSGKSDFTWHLTDELIAAAIPDPEQLQLLREIGFRSVMTVPLIVRENVFGTLSLIATTESGRLFSQDDLQFAEEIGRRAALAIENARLFRAVEESEARQRHIADTLQQAMLLAPPHEGFPGLEVDTYYEAAWDESLVGGDFDDAFAVGDHQIAILVGDGTGKGLAAARFMAECQFMARAFLRENPDPANALARLNRVILNGQQFDDRPEGAMTTLVVAVIDTQSGDTRISAGGAEPPLIVRAASGALEMVDITGALLGMVPFPQYESVRAVLHRGDTIVLTSDGTTEARNRKTRAFFGYDGLTGAVSAVVGGGVPTHGSAEEIVARAKRFAGGSLADDACVLVARFTGVGAESHQDFPCAYSVCQDFESGRSNAVDRPPPPSPPTEQISEQPGAAAVATDPSAPLPERGSAVAAAAPDDRTLALQQSLAAALLECVTTPEVVATVLDRGLVALGAAAGMVVLVRGAEDSPAKTGADRGEQQGYLETVAAHGYANDVVGAWKRIPLSASLPLSDAVREKAALYFTGRADMMARYPHMYAQGPTHPTKASVSLPLVARGRAIGALHFSLPDEREGFTAGDRAFVEELARQSALALDRALLLDDVQTARHQVELILDSIEEMFYAVDSEFRFTYVNRRTVEFWGRTREELLGRNLWDEFPTVVGTIAYDQLTLAMRERRAVVYDTDSVRSGHRVNCSAYPAEDGGLAIYFRDIHARTEAERALRGSEERYRRLLDTALEGVLFLDARGNIASVNERLALMLAYDSPSDLIGRPVVFLFFPEDEGLAHNKWSARLKGVAEQYELRLRRADGGECWVIAHVSIERDERTGAMLGTFTMMTDITDRKRSMEERERLLAEQRRLVASLELANARQQDHLLRSEERFRLLVEGVRDYAIFMLDPEGYVTTWNAGAERFKGYRAQDIIGQHFSRFYTEVDIARRHPWAELEIAARDGRYEEEGWRVRKDGSRFWANVIITALRDDTGRLCGFAKVTRDVTDRRMREEERAAAQSLDQQRRFLKDVLASVTQGKLVLCDSAIDLPVPQHDIAIGEPIALSRQALKAVRSRTTEAAARCRLPLDREQDLVTAASECAMNAVQHAGGGSARIYADAASGRLQVWIRDEGKGIALSDLPRATLEPGYGTGGGGIGHGFFLMLSLADRLYLLTGPAGTTIVLEKRLVSQEPAWLQVAEGAAA
jgi:PAS domain S-box-containing protein